MENNYLRIIEAYDGLIEINSSDGAFVSYVTIDKEDFKSYCEGKANDWLESELGNYDDLSNEDRKVIASKWIAAKSLEIGNYEYYFNFEDVKDLFSKAVEDLAKNMGIKEYTLSMN